MSKRVPSERHGRRFVSALVGLGIVVVRHRVSKPRWLPAAARASIKDPLGIVWEPLSDNPQMTGGSSLS